MAAIDGIMAAIDGIMARIDGLKKHIFGTIMCWACVIVAATKQHQQNYIHFGYRKHDS